MSLDLVAFVQDQVVKVHSSIKGSESGYFGHFISGQNDIIGGRMGHHFMLLMDLFLGTRSMQSKEFEARRPRRELVAPTAQNTEGTND